MKIVNYIMTMLVLTMPLSAQEIVFRLVEDPASTGALFEGTEDKYREVDMPEIEGLTLWARSAVEGHMLNGALSENAFGILQESSEGNPTRFDYGEQMYLYFNHSLSITEIDFVGFREDSRFEISTSEHEPIVIEYDDLGTHQTYTTQGIVVDKEQIVSFSVGTTNSVIGLQSMRVTLVENEIIPHISISATGDEVQLQVTSEQPFSSIYQLASSTNLSEDIWTLENEVFTSNTNISVPQSEQIEFFRLEKQ